MRIHRPHGLARGRVGSAVTSTHHRLPRLAAALAAGLSLLACASSGFDGQVYRGEGMTFRVGPVPSTWRRVEVDQSLVAFRDDDAQATVAVNGRCGQDGDDVPLTALTAHLFLHFTERRMLDQQRIPMDGREALRTELVAKLDGVPKHFTVVVLKKDGCVYDFLHITDGNASGEQEEFQRFVRGFATLS